MTAMTKTSIKISVCFICFIAVLTVCLSAFGVPSSAASGSVHFIDDANVIPAEHEKLIKEKANEAAAMTGFNIVIMTTNDIGTPKTDAHVVEFCDDKYEELCGIDTTGILFLINCDTKYDYISTSGECIEYFSDARIDAIFDTIWDDLKEENFGQAAYTFLFRVEYYYEQGRVNNEFHRLTGSAHIDLSALSRFIVFCGVATLMIGLGIYNSNKKQYNIEKPTTRNYILNNSLVFDNKSDVFVGREIHKTYSPRSSSSGSHRSSRSSHHSSTHRSHSGGRHGGGGRHR